MRGLRFTFSRNGFTHLSFRGAPCRLSCCPRSFSRIFPSLSSHSGRVGCAVLGASVDERCHYQTQQPDDGAGDSSDRSPVHHFCTAGGFRISIVGPLIAIGVGFLFQRG